MTLSTETTPFSAIVLALWGLVDCFFGFRLFKIVLAILGAFVGGMLAMTGAMQAFPGNEVLSWVALAIGALIGGVCAYAIMIVGVFIAGFALGWVITLGAHRFTGDLPMLAVAAGVGLVFGIIGVFLQRFIITAATAWSGALRVALAVAFFTQHLEPLDYLRDPQRVPPLLESHSWIMITTVVLGFIGFWIQLAANRRADAPSAPAPRAEHA